MPRPSRAKSDSQPKSPESSRKSLHFSPRKSTKYEDHRDTPLQSPTSPTTRKTPRKAPLDEPRPSTPEEWIEFAKTRLGHTAGIPVTEAVLDLAELEPDLLEFLITADEEIRNRVHDALCGSSFPTTREAWKDSTSCLLIERFRTYLNRLPPKLVDHKVDEAGRQMTLLVTALEAFDYITFGVGNKSEQNEEEEDPFFKVKGNKSQKKRKASVSIANRARRNTVTVDPRVFKAVDFEFPTCLKDALEIEFTLLLRLREVLEVFLAAFDNHELVVHAHELFFKQPLQFIPVKLTPKTIAEATVDTSLTDAPDAGAFPHIRPLAAARYFDEGPALGAWNLIVASRAISDLRQMQKRDSKGFEMVQKKITELSQGFFSDDNQKRLVGLGTEVPIYEAKVSRDVRIVYQIDLDTDVEAKIDQQIIKLYGIYTHAQLDDRMWSLVSYYISRRGSEYRQRCLYRDTPRAPGQNVTLPGQFPHEEDLEALVEGSNEAPSLGGMSDQDYLDLHALIAMEKFIPMSQLLIDSILHDTDTASHPFRPSAKEKEIIYHKSACFVLGRSGTGKTTSIVLKMLGIEKLFESMEDVAKPRQVFVTQSRLLTQRVQIHYQNLVRGVLGSETSRLSEDQGQVLADLEDEHASAFGLPPKYSMLEDHHFPLFLSFDQLCSLLEADFGLQFGRPIRNETHTADKKGLAIPGITDVNVDRDQGDKAGRTNSNELSVFGFGFSPAISEYERVQRAKQSIITFDLFLAAYWPRFDRRLTKGLDPALVYNEFLGIIEGSESALKTKCGALSREDYAHTSRRSTFASERDRIYDLYESYCKRRGKLGGYDVAERTHSLVTATNTRVPGQKLDCLYIDEAQDNLLIDIKLLHNLSSNPHGIFMTGDTAQTISAGSSFRFEDLKAFMWRLEEQDEAVRCKKRRLIHPVLFHLAVNYRSHGGIVDCASSVVQLISELFPGSIDKLKRETGLTEGPKPVFFSGWESGTVHFEQFLRGGADASIDFGASQVILVRNDAARNALRAQLGEIGIILTLYESKGLEFNDVLLYNFFEDSAPSASTWRIVLQGLHTTNVGPTPQFDEVRHAVICAELKHLYVGLTRARNHCWIWDVSEKSEPMKTFWTKKNLVVRCGPHDPMPQLGVSSSQADWAKSGRLYFDKRLYPQAIFCFEKANMRLERDIAAAYEARKQSRLLQAAKLVDRTTRQASFLRTASDFMRCAERSTGKQQISCYLRAAECFSEAEQWKAAAEAFSSANEFDMAAKSFRRAGCFDEAVDVVKNHRDQVQKNVAEDIIGVARLEYLRTAKYEQAGELFDDVEEQLEYMGDYGFDRAQIHLLEDQQRYDQAAEVAFSERNIVEGIRLLLRSDSSTSMRKTIKYALYGLWTVLPLAFGPPGDKLQNAAIASLVQYLRSDKLRVLNRDETYQFEVFQALHANDPNRVLSLAEAHGGLAQEPDSHYSSCNMLALLCFSYSSPLLVPTKDSTIHGFIAKSKLSFTYLSLLLHLGRTLDPTCSNTQMLLGFEPVESNHSNGSEGEKSTSTDFWVHSTSLMFEAAQNVPGVSAPTLSPLGVSSLVLSELDTRRLTIDTIYNMLRSQVRNVHDVANHLRYLHPCLDFAIFGKCHKSDCGRQEVYSFKLAEEQRQDLFNLRVRALILQLQTIHVYQAQTPLDEAERRNFRRTWARKFYELLMPHFPPLGSTVCVDRTSIPEIGRGTDIISTWCEDALHYLDPRYGNSIRFLSDALAYMDLAFRVHLDRFAAYAPTLHSSRLVKWREDLFLNIHGRRYSIVHDFINFYVRKSDDAIRRVIRAMHYVTFNHLTIEANVLVHTLEFIGREVIVQCRGWSRGQEGVFDGLLVPQSWALDLLKRPRLLAQNWFALPDYINILCKSLERLRIHETNVSGLFGFNGPLSPLVRSVLIARICRLLILVPCNIGFNRDEKNEVGRAIASSFSGPGEIHSLCIGFARAESWSDLEKALTTSPLNRGADSLVYLSLRRRFSRPLFFKGVKTISYTSILPELLRLLSFSEPAKRPGNTIDPGVKTHVPTVQSLLSAHNGDAALEGEQAAGQTEADAFGDLIPSNSQIDYLSSAAKPQTERDLTPEEVDMGRKILFFYRRYALRQRVKAGRAIRVIWAYYSRYRLRHKAPRTVTGDRIRKLHSEYKEDVESRAYPLLLAKVFQRYKRILLGSMPHVTVFVHGLDNITRQQKVANKKRLQDKQLQHKELEQLQFNINVCTSGENSWPGEPHRAGEEPEAARPRRGSESFAELRRAGWLNSPKHYPNKMSCLNKIASALF